MVPFLPLNMQGTFQLRIDVHDDAPLIGPFVDEVFIEPISFPLNASLSVPTLYLGVARRSSLELSLQVLCKDDFYGTDCNTYCVGNEQYSCDREGNRMCQPDYYVLPECSVHCVSNDSQFTCDPDSGAFVCQENYFTDECDVFCEEQSDELFGFYTCSPITGERECMPGYIDPDTNCTTRELINQIKLNEIAGCQLKLYGLCASMEIAGLSDI